MKKALIVGIDHYDSHNIKNLSGCINDANHITTLLSNHYGVNEEKGEPNFDCKKLVSSEQEYSITRSTLLGEIRNLMEDNEADIALFYFSGHGFESSLGGYLLPQDARDQEEGISFNDVMIYANNSSIKEIVIILDCCSSGHIGNIPISTNQVASIRKGVSILTASTGGQYAMEVQGRGVFTTLICNALEGGNTDLLGNVKISHVYELAERTLGAWDQRPTFKSNSARLTVLRKTRPRISLEILRKITIYFVGPNYSYKLDPTYEPTEKNGNEENERIFGHLQKMTSLGLVEPKNAEHMYYAAIHGKHCALTEQGKQYWHLITKGLI